MVDLVNVEYLDLGHFAKAQAEEFYAALPDKLGKVDQPIAFEDAYRLVGGKLDDLIQIYLRAYCASVLFLARAGFIFALRVCTPF